MKKENKHELNRRKFISALALIGTTASLNPLATFAGTVLAQEDTSAIMKCKPYLQGVQTNAMNIRWVTAVKCFSWVEFGESAEKLDKKVYRINDGLIEANNTNNDILLDGLEAGKTYYYKAVSRKINAFGPYNIVFGDTAESKVYSFNTIPSTVDKVKFVVFNDVHERPETFAHMMQFQEPGKNDFVLLNGDIFSSLRTGEDQVMQNLINPVTDLFASQTPFIFSRGNHETRGQFCRQLPDYLNGKERKFYYSLKIGPMYALVLDTGEASEDNNPLYGGIIDFDHYRLEQKAWLEKEVQKKEFKRAKYRVVINHVPPFYTLDENQPVSAFCRKHWGPIFNKSKIDLMISAHIHVHGVHLPVADKHNYPIVIGGGPKNGERTIIDVKISQHALDVKIKDDSGKTVGTLSL